MNPVYLLGFTSGYDPHFHPAPGKGDDTSGAENPDGPIPYSKAAKMLGQLIFDNGKTLLLPENSRPIAAQMRNDTERPVILAERLRRAADFYDSFQGQNILASVSGEKNKEITTVLDQLKKQKSITVDKRGLLTDIRYVTMGLKSNQTMTHTLQVDQLITDDAKAHAYKAALVYSRK